MPGRAKWKTYSPAELQTSVSHRSPASRSIPAARRRQTGHLWTTFPPRHTRFPSTEPPMSNHLLWPRRATPGQSDSRLQDEMGVIPNTPGAHPLRHRGVPAIPNRQKDQGRRIQERQTAAPCWKPPSYDGEASGRALLEAGYCLRIRSTAYQRRVTRSGSLPSIAAAGPGRFRLLHELCERFLQTRLTVETGAGRRVARPIDQPLPQLVERMGRRRTSNQPGPGPPRQEPLVPDLARSRNRRKGLHHLHHLVIP